MDQKSIKPPVASKADLIQDPYNGLEGAWRCRDAGRGVGFRIHIMDQKSTNEGDIVAEESIQDPYNGLEDQISTVFALMHLNLGSI